MLKFNDLLKKSKPELLKMISELKGKLLSLRFEASTGQLKEAHLLSETKKDIARIFTAIKVIDSGAKISFDDSKMKKGQSKVKIEKTKEVKVAQPKVETKAKTYALVTSDKKQTLETKLSKQHVAKHIRKAKSEHATKEVRLSKAKPKAKATTKVEHKTKHHKRVAKTQELKLKTTPKAKKATTKKEGAK